MERERERGGENLVSLLISALPPHPSSLFFPLPPRRLRRLCVVLFAKGVRERGKEKGLEMTDNHHIAKHFNLYGSAFYFSCVKCTLATLR